MFKKGNIYILFLTIGSLFIGALLALVIPYFKN